MALSNGPFIVKLVDNNNQDIPMQNEVFYLNDQQEYAVYVKNTDSHLRADATIYIDGKEVGCFRLETNSPIRIERPSDDNKAKKFTFLKIDSDAGRAAKVDKSPSPGELKVVIDQEELAKPAVRRVYTAFGGGFATTDGAFSNNGMCSLGASPLGDDEFDCALGMETDSCARSLGRATGGTGLGSNSSQRFRTACHIKTGQQYTLLGRMQLKEKFVEL